MTTAAPQACTDVLLLIQRSDVLALAAQPNRFSGHKLVTLDQGILDDCLQQGITGVEFRRVDADPDLQARACTEALMRSTLLDLRLATLRRDVLGGGVGLFDGWDVGLFHASLNRLLVARSLADAVERSFPEARIGLLRPMQPMQAYHDSFLVPDLMARDPQRWRTVGDYDGVRLYQGGAYDFAFDTPAIAAALRGANPPSAITHVPTCFYDRARIEDELARVHPVSLDLPSLFWDVPVRRGIPLLRPLASLPPIDPRCDRYAERARQVLRESLFDLLPQPAARERQLDSWTQRCRVQAIDYLGLRTALQGHAPQFILTDHDTGRNGVLFTVAEALGASITVVPHSNHPAMVLPHARRVTAIERAGFGSRARTLLGQPVAMRKVRWLTASAPPQPQPQANDQATRVRTICLLLNTAHTEGLTYTDLLSLVAFYKPLAALCERHDIELVVRPKPGAPALNVLSSAFGLNAQRLLVDLQQPLETVARRTQLCVAYGEPSTGMLAFIDAGAYVLNACQPVWPTDLVACPPLVAEGVVPSLRLNDALQAVQRCIVDAATFSDRRRVQAAAVSQRAEGAHDTLFAHTSPLSPTPAGA